MNAPGITPLIEWQGPQAIGANERLVGGKYVTLIQDVSNTDAEGNILRYVMVDNIFVNYDMIRLGMARAVNIPPDEACKDSFLAAELEAQANIVGIWLPTPVPTFTLTLTPTITRTPAPTTIPPCNCYGRRLTCNNFYSQAQAQACFNYCRSQGLDDIFGLDKNRNGVACEGSR